jgi:hypothetical protein
MSSLDEPLMDATLYALALGCPRCAGQPDCALSAIHRLPVSMRFSAIRKLSPDQRQAALRGHEGCIGQALRHGPLVEGCLRLLQIERRIGTAEEKAGDLDHAVLTAHELRNMMARIMAEDGDLLLE